MIQVKEERAVDLAWLPHRHSRGWATVRGHNLILSFSRVTLLGRLLPTHLWGVIASHPLSLTDCGSEYFSAGGPSSVRAGESACGAAHTPYKGSWDIPYLRVHRAHGAHSHPGPVGTQRAGVRPLLISVRLLESSFFKSPTVAPGLELSR